MKKTVLYFISLISLVVSAISFGDIQEQYSTVDELIYEHGDYDAGNNTFEMYSVDPVAFRLSKASIQGEPEGVTYYENWRAAIYGVYNTFAHTSIESVTVTAMPLWFESFMKRDDERLLEDRAITLSMDRAQALTALQSVIDVDDLHDIKSGSDFGYQWSEDFLDVYYEGRSPGLDAFIEALEEYQVN